MSVLIVTSLGDIVIDLHTDRCSLTTKNFLKLCKIKYFNGCLFHTVQKDFTAQTGDPTGKGTGGDSVYKFLYGDQARFFGDEIHPDLKHSKTGTVAMASAGENLNASQFYFTLRDDLDYLDGKHTVFGEVAEGIDTLMRINEAYVDDKGRPYKNIRIKHTYILDDPFEDPPQLTELIPERSPEGKPLDEMEEVRLEDDWVPMDETLGPAELEEALRLKEAQSNAVFLETVGDIPDAEIKPPENVLFVCKLNPVTQDEDLDTIFSRFGTVLSAEVIRDYKTGDSLCYAFIEFETNEACEQAYFKMDNALIDDRRIHVDFSQSVAKLWSQYRRGKGNQNGKGRGCFKCGGLDHIAKDCAESPTTKKQNPKYTLKDENTQRGGDARQSYDMVFDGDTLPGLDREDKKHREHKTEDETKRWKRGNDQSSGDFRSKRDSTNNGDREGHDHSNSGRREERSQGTRGSSRDYEHQGGRYSRERMSERCRDEENRKKRHDDDHPRRAKQDDRKRSNDHDVDPPRREDRDDKKRNKYSNDNNHGQGQQDDEKSRDQDGDRDSRQRRHINSDIDRHRRDERYENKRSIGHSGNPHKREGGDKKRETEHHSSADRRDGQDDRKRTTGRDATSPDRKREYEKRR